MGLEAKTLEERASWLIQASDWLAMISARGPGDG
jgi:hypothetical protein